MSEGVAKVYKNQQLHDPSDIHRAREIASSFDPIPVGILYRNDEVPCYEDVRLSGELRTTERIKKGLESEFDKVTVWPEQEQQAGA